VHRDGLHAQLATGALDTQGDLAAVGDQDLFEHLDDREQRLAVFHRLPILVPA
jgi:hypothetical protein